MKIKMNSILWWIYKSKYNVSVSYDPSFKSCANGAIEANRQANLAASNALEANRQAQARVIDDLTKKLAAAEEELRILREKK